MAATEAEARSFLPTDPHFAARFKPDAWTFLTYQPPLNELRGGAALMNLSISQKSDNDKY
uniref:Uncharacterized protein n=2 Tax=Salmonella sp. TaxID=599 RepID=A0A482ETT6_SALSP|nr:hypothetical protein NNIBIDOC_00234 [Salmonella sp.]